MTNNNWFTEIIQIKNFKICYQYHIDLKTAHKRPTIVLVPPIFDIRDIKKSLKLLATKCPIYLLDFSSVDLNCLNLSNTKSEKSKRKAKSKENAKEKKAKQHNYIEQYSQITKIFCDKLGFEKINLIGHSLTSLIAHHFCTQYPLSINKVILHDISKKLKESTLMIFKKKIIQIKEDLNFNSITSCFFNISRMSMILKSHETIKHFRQHIENLSDNKKQYLIQLMQAAIYYECNEDATVNVDCLLLAGQYSHVYTPYEAFKIGEKYFNKTFAIIKRVDDLAILEKRHLVQNIYHDFFEDREAIENLSGIYIYSGDKFSPRRRQIEPRYKWNCEVSVSYSNALDLDLEGNLQVKINILDMNAQGCKIKIIDSEEKNFTNTEMQTSIFPDLSTTLLIFKKSNENIYHAIFEHKDIEASKIFIQLFSEKIKDKSSFIASNSSYFSFS